MPNWNPLTNAVGGAGATKPKPYYNTQPTNFGEYQYIKLTEVVDNFMAVYTGENKILQNVLRGDVNFHAHRALQELHYDTLKSCKSHEIEVCPSLIMPLPHDYVNYVKITSVDENGIEHVIYPTRHTSHPFAIQQDECAYEFNDDGTLKHQVECTTGTETTCDPTEFNAITQWLFKNQGNISFPINPDMTSYGSTIYDGTVTIANEVEFVDIVKTLIDDHCQCLSTNPDAGRTRGADINTRGSGTPTCGNCVGGNKGNQIGFGLNGAITVCWDNLNNALVGGGGAPIFQGPITFTSKGSCELTSNAWTNYSTSGGTTTGISPTHTNDPSVDSDNYFQNEGQRYGLTPEHSQINGSFFIDCMRGNIHFGSNFSGKTVILHYISDGHGTEDEEIVHKFAEEAMYKWIAYGCAQARIDVDPNTIARLKKEKFAETRKAKIRLSNLKIEEVAQVMRNKSKWIKH